MAVVAAFVVAEAAVLLLRPRDGVIAPAPVDPGSYFTPDQLDEVYRLTVQIARRLTRLPALGLALPAQPPAVEGSSRVPQQPLSPAAPRCSRMSMSPA